MSADNWATCPKCKIRVEAESNKLKLDAGKAYGKVSPEEYLVLFETANKPVKLDDTLREDYEIGITSDGKFYASYGGACQCGFSFSFKHECDTLKPRKP